MNRFLPLGLLAAFGILAVAGADHAPVKYYVQLIWGTNGEKPPECPFRAVGPRLEKKLSRVFQWKHYWEVNCQEVTVSKGKLGKLRLSDKCQVEIEFVSDQLREVRLYGKGKHVESSRRPIDRKGMSIHGGGTQVGDSWFVVIREDKPPQSLPLTQHPPQPH